jgi:hypothetical protein
MCTKIGIVAHIAWSTVFVCVCVCVCVRALADYKMQVNSESWNSEGTCCICEECCTTVKVLFTIYEDVIVFSTAVFVTMISSHIRQN